MKIALIGAGSAQFGLGTLGDIFLAPALRGAEIALVDIDGSGLKRVHDKAAAYIAARSLPFHLSASTDRRVALRGADFVIISIEVGNRFELWDQDWNIPLQFGVPQIYGENGGPGGLFHALRIIPPILDIAADVESLCPDAFVFSYSNPMTAIVTTVLRKFPEMRFSGLCHEIASAERYLPAILDTSLENIAFRAAGLNHFSVLLEASFADSGEDAYGAILEKAPAFFERLPGYSDVWEYAQRTGALPHTEGTTERYKIDRQVSSRAWSDRTLFREILEKFHLFPITVDSHIGEYLAWAHYAADHQGILDFYAFYRRLLASGETEIEERMKERVVPIMAGIIEDRHYEERAVNLMNDGYIPALPDFVAVEVPAVVTARGFEAHRFPDYPKGFAALLRNYCGVYDLTAEAVLTGKRDYVVQALLASPIAVDPRRVGELVDIMLERQQKWLDYVRNR